MPAAMRRMREKFFRWAAKLEQQQCAKRILSHRSSRARQARWRQMRRRRWPTRSRSWASTAAPNWPRPNARCRTACAPRALAAGVGMTAPETVFFSHDTVLEADVEIGPYVVFGPGVHGAKAARGIRSHSPSRRRRGRGRRDHRALSRGCVPARAIGEDAHIGNFVEVKNTRDRKGRQGQSSHLSGRRAGGRGRQYRRGHHHLQLRRLRQAPSPRSARAPSSAPTPRWWRR